MTIIDCNDGLGGRLARWGNALRPEAVFHLESSVADEAWIGAGSDSCYRHIWMERIDSLARGGTRVLNFFHDIRADGSDCAAVERDISDRCRMLGVGYRIFGLPVVLNDEPVRSGLLARFLTALYDFEREIEERVSSYFEYRALRLPWSSEALIGVISEDEAAAQMLKISGDSSTLNSSFRVPPSHSISLGALCDAVRSAFASSLVPAGTAEPLNAIDLAFQSRLKQAGCGLPLIAAREATGTQRRLDAGQIASLGRLRTSLDTERRERDRRVARMRESLEQTTIMRAGCPLTWYSGGRGERPILLLNALGQDVDYWFRLVDELMQKHRVIVWEPRGSTLPPHPFTLADQTDDIASILEHENARECSLVGWCTGPKVALEFYTRHPEAVSAMVFLNATFRCAGTPPELETQYERNSEPLFRMVAQRPSMASSVIRSLKSSAGGPEIDLENETDALRLAEDVCSAMNAALKPHVAKPFQSESVMVHYAGQVVDFWSRDSLAHAHRVEVPVLLVASEHDRVASPEASRQAARLFPLSRFEWIPSATHYCLYDRPRFLAAMIDEFLTEVAQPARDRVALTAELA